jgi:hypothetical protein
MLQPLMARAQRGLHRERRPSRLGCLVDGEQGLEASGNRVAGFIRACMIGSIEVSVDERLVMTL